MAWKWVLRMTALLDNKLLDAVVEEIDTTGVKDTFEQKVVDFVIGAGKMNFRR